MKTNARKLSTFGGWIGCSLYIVYREIHNGEAHILARILGGLVLPTIGFTIYYFVWDKLSRRKPTLKPVSETENDTKEALFPNIQLQNRPPETVDSESAALQSPASQISTLQGFAVGVVVLIGFIILVVLNPTSSVSKNTPSVNSQPLSADGNIPSPGGLTRERELELLQEHNLDPEKWRLIDPSVERTQNAFNPSKAGARYFILVNSKVRYWSKNEPKPFGSGFKFISIRTGEEMTVSGNVQIRKLV